MPYRLTLAIDGTTSLHIEHETLQEVCDDYDKLGGDSNWILNAGRASIAASRHGEAAAVVARTLGGEVIEVTDDPFPSQDAEAERAEDAEDLAPPETRPEDPFAPEPAATPPASTVQTDVGSVPGQRSAIVSGSRTVPPSDPWNTTPEIEDPHPSGCRCQPCLDKTWPGEATVAREALTSRNPSSSDPWGAEAAAAEPVAPDKPVVKHDNYGRQWTLNLPDAPPCECGEKSAKVKGRSKKNQRIYEGWMCARAMSDNWKNKCALWRSIA